MPNEQEWFPSSKLETTAVDPFPDVQRIVEVLDSHHFAGDGSFSCNWANCWILRIGLLRY
jgi:hypothetical protein